jgi:hypothetical protein
MKATKDNRYGHRDATMILVAYRQASDLGRRNKSRPRGLKPLSADRAQSFYSPRSSRPRFSTPAARAPKAPSGFPYGRLCWISEFELDRCLPSPVCSSDCNHPLTKINLSIINGRPAHDA